MKDLKQILVAALVLLFAGIYVASLIQLSRRFGNQEGFWTAASAIGTWFAALVALMLGFKEFFQRRREAEAKAKITAARILSMLNDASDNADSLRLALLDLVSSENRLLAPGFILSQISAVTPVRFNGIAADELSSLMPLPDNCAMKLARAISLFETVAQDLALENEWGRIPGDYLFAKFDSWKWRIEEAQALLSTAIVICNEASVDLTARPYSVD